MKIKWFMSGIGAALVGTIVLAALYPLQYDSREELFEIPQGTWAQRMAGNPVSILPDHIFLAVEARNILVLKNLDDVPQIFGPTLIMPGQSFKLPFDSAGEYYFACTAHVSGQMTVVVDPEPNPGWFRLQWRAKTFARWLSGKY
jgi:hypothetical protein